MKCKVLKSFPYAHDGNAFETLAEGEEREIRDILIPGLVAAGLIAKPEVQSPLPGMVPGAPDNKMLDSAPSRKRRERRQS